MTFSWKGYSPLSREHRAALGSAQVGDPRNVLEGVRKVKTDADDRAKTAPIDSLRLYTPEEVAKILAVSYDTAIRRMRTMKGHVDLGSKESLHKRPKAKLRISGKHLQAYLRKCELTTE